MPPTVAVMQRTVQQLYHAGYRNMQVLDEGLPGWQQQQQYPLEGLRQQSAIR